MGTKVVSDVVEEFAWDPSVDHRPIRVLAVRGGVALEGVVSSAEQRAAVEKAAVRVCGARVLVNRLEVAEPAEDSDPVADERHAEELTSLLGLQRCLASSRIRVRVRNSTVVLEGETEWDYARRWAECAVRNILWVHNVVNAIALRHVPAPSDLEVRLGRALERNVHVDGARIAIEHHRGVVRLNGSVSSWAQRMTAERIAWSAPGVEQVVNLLRVD